MPTIPDPVVLSSVGEVTVPPTPGWRTSEFWLKVAAIALSALFASGALTNNTALAIAGMAATILGALGYTVSRTIVKTAGMLLVVGLFASTQTACGPKTTALAHGIWDCLAPERAEAVAVLTPLAESAILAAASADGKLIDASKLKAITKADLTTEAGVLLECAMASAVTTLLSPTPASSGSSALELDPVALRDAWHRAAPPGARFATAHGEI